MLQNHLKYNQDCSPLLHYRFAYRANSCGNAIANLLGSLHTGKERDSETGFSYFGARYYDSDLMTGWLSVDPMADKYPNISPYAYCAWNPIRLVDPDGEEIWIVGDDGTKIKYKANMTSSHIKDKVLSQQIQILNDMYSVEIGSEVLNTLISSSTKYTISNKSGINKGNCVTRKKGNEVFIKMGGHNDLLNMSHELFHAFQYENNQGGATIYNEVEAFLYSAGVATTFEFLKEKVEEYNLLYCLKIIIP